MCKAFAEKIESKLGLKSGLQTILGVINSVPSKKH